MSCDCEKYNPGLSFMGYVVGIVVILLFVRGCIHHQKDNLHGHKANRVYASDRAVNLYSE